MVIRARHILVQHRHEAEDLKKRLDRGEDFADLAQKYSLCSSASQGGFLGEIQASRLNSDFREGLENLKSGEISAPVRTSFGYHLIKRE